MCIARCSVKLSSSGLPVRLLGLGLFLLFGISTSAQQRMDELPEGMESFEQTIPGTTISFTMIPIPGGVVDVEREVAAPEEGGEATKEIVEVEVAPFYMLSTEVTWDLYDVLVFRFDLPESDRRGKADPDGISRPTNPYIATDRGYGHNGWPAISISHQGALSLCEWLTVKTGKRFRLPTEDEWEHAARAGTPRSAGRWWFGDDQEEFKQQGWFRLNSNLKTHAVGTLPANPLGLFDIYGNTSEWCTTTAGGYVMRGGSFQDRSNKANSFYRSIPHKGWNATDPQLPKSPWWLADGPFAGFRVICEADDGKPAPSKSAK